MRISEVIKNIQRSKNIGARKLSERCGIKYNKLVPKRLDAATVPTLKRICDALGVELCIMDGFKKYKLNDFPGMPELDIMLGEMNSIFDNEDRYLTRERSANATVSYYIEERRANCRGCIYCDPKRTKFDRYWCEKNQSYKNDRRCKDKVERDIPQVFK